MLNYQKWKKTCCWDMGKMTSVSCIPHGKTVHNCGLVLLHLSIMVSSTYRKHVKGHKQFYSEVLLYVHWITQDLRENVCICHTVLLQDKILLGFSQTRADQLWTGKLTEGSRNWCLLPSQILELAAKLVEHIVGYLEFFVNLVNSKVLLRWTSYAFFNLLHRSFNILLHLYAERKAGRI